MPGPDKDAQASLSPEYFDELYQAKPDPWNFTSSDYEAEKYARTVSLLNRPRYRSGLEIGCSIGILTRMLAAKCEEFLAIDVSELALSQARERNADLTHVRFDLKTVPREYPEGNFDLTVLSEVGYYWSFDDLKEGARLIHSHTDRDGQLLLVHWLPPEPDHRVTADQVHEHFLASPSWHCAASYRGDKYRMELLERRD